MGSRRNPAEREQRTHQDGAVSITDLGDRSTDTPRPAPGEPPPNRAPRSRRRTFALAVVLGTGLIAGLALLPPAFDTSSPESTGTSTPTDGAEASSTTTGIPVPDVPNACDAVGQDQASATTRQDDVSLTQKLPAGYSRYGVMTSPDTTELIGVLHPDGTLQVCEESALTASLEVRFPTEADLGQLPEEMTYAYGSHGASKDGLSLQLKGVRLPDGSVVDSTTLPDGRIVPTTPVLSQ